MILIEFISSIVSLLVFIYLLIVSINMTVYDNFWTSPGVFPIILNSSLIILCITWIADNLRKIYKENKNTNIFYESKKLIKRNLSKVIRFSELVFVLFMYIFVLTPYIGFTYATLIFILISYWLFESENANFIKVLLVSGFVALLVYLAFEYVLNLPMPS